MKLIINIPDDDYKILNTTGAWNSSLIECIKNGIPFDDVKAEIELLKADGLANMQSVLNVFDILIYNQDIK